MFNSTSIFRNFLQCGLMEMEILSESRNAVNLRSNKNMFYFIYRTSSKKSQVCIRITQGLTKFLLGIHKNSVGYFS